MDGQQAGGQQQGKPILVTGCGGRIGGTGTHVVELLRKKNLPVRALVYRDDERAVPLRKLGAEVVVGDLTNIDDAERVVKGCRSIYFTFPVASNYVTASLQVTAAAKKYGVEVFVNMSQMNLAAFQATKSSTQVQAHWLAERALEWSGIPVVNVWAGLFLENPVFTHFAKEAIIRADELRTPLGPANSVHYPIAAYDLARVVTNILTNPAPYIGKNIVVIGPKTTLEQITADLSAALGRPIKYVDVPHDTYWDAVRPAMLAYGVEEHIIKHLVEMGKWMHSGGALKITSEDIARESEVLGGGTPFIRPAQHFREHLELYK